MTESSTRTSRQGRNARPLAVRAAAKGPPQANMANLSSLDYGLIAELDSFMRRKEERGKKPLPFQQVQNEALELWIEKHVRSE